MQSGSEGYSHSGCSIAFAPPAQAFDKWRAEHTATALSVRQAVNDPTSSDAALRPLVEEARGQLWTLFAMKKAVICSESVLIIMNMEHLLPSVSCRCSLTAGSCISGCLCGALRPLSGSTSCTHQVWMS